MSTSTKPNNPRTETSPQSTDEASWTRHADEASSTRRADEVSSWTRHTDEAVDDQSGNDLPEGDETGNLGLETFNFFPDDVDRESSPPRFPNAAPLTDVADPNSSGPDVVWEPIDGHDDLRAGWPLRELVGARTIATVFGVVALVEAVFLVDFVLRPSQPSAIGASPVPVTISSPVPGDVVLVDGRPVGVTPFQLEVNASMHSIGIHRSEVADAALAQPAQPTAPPRLAPPRPANAAAAPARPVQRSGSLRLSSPIDVQVVQGETVLGWSTDAQPIVFSAGVHQLDLVNAALGFRARQIVTITSGEVATVTVTPPNGLLSINAQPWAQVWIDGKPVGETPLANVPVPIGEHEIVFRHPQLGEKRQKARVSVGTPMRLTARMGS